MSGMNTMSRATAHHLRVLYQNRYYMNINSRYDIDVKDIHTCICIHTCIQAFDWARPLTSLLLFPVNDMYSYRTQIRYCTVQHIKLWNFNIWGSWNILVSFDSSHPPPTLFAEYSIGHCMLLSLSRIIHSLIPTRYLNHLLTVACTHMYII